jgi:hypothetical protein
VIILLYKETYLDCLPSCRPSRPCIFRCLNYPHRHYHIQPHPSPSPTVTIYYLLRHTIPWITITIKIWSDSMTADFQFPPYWAALLTAEGRTR